MSKKNNQNNNQNKESMKYTKKVCNAIKLADTLINKLNKEELSPSKLAKFMRIEESTNCEVEDYVKGFLKTVITDKEDNNDIIDLCGLVAVDFNGNTNKLFKDSIVNINNLFILAGKGSKFNNTKFTIFDTEIDKFIRFKTTVSKYFLKIELFEVEKDTKLPNDIPVGIEISLDHDRRYAIVKCAYDDYAHDGVTIYNYRARADYGLNLVSLEDDNLAYRRITASFIRFIFKVLRDKWYDYTIYGTALNNADGVDFEYMRRY